MNITPDDICQEYRRKGAITIRALPEDGDTIVIEADREGLEFLGKLFLAQAQAADCGFQIGPFGAGKVYFSRQSTKGLYLHRLHTAAPRKPGNGKRKTRRSKKAAIMP
jgi:hypothetical protein